MIALVKRAKLSWFAYYCLLIGSLAIVYTLTS
jgi:undecaprenyl pyrophosphate phosphatase UppP